VRDGKLYARAAPEKVEITEDYSVRQEISSNPGRETGPCAGRIEMAIPYDGETYFTRQAADDVKWGSRAGGGQGTAVIGHLLLSDHARTGDLRSAMTMHHNVGVIPIEVNVPTAVDELDRLTDDRLKCVIAYDYQPQNAEILPIRLDVELYDPDTTRLKAVDLLSRWGEIDLAPSIDRLRRDASFTSGLEMSIVVRLALPVKRGANPVPRVKLMSVDWPAITSLSTTQLERDTTQAERAADAKSERPHPVRYNPVLRRLEWEDIPVEAGTDADGTPDKRLFSSVTMRLKIGHPGELFTTPELFREQKLKIHAEVEVPGYLLSGLGAWLFGATGDWQRRPRPDASGDWPRPGEQYPWEPALTTRVSIDTECRVLDMFAEREFKPYLQFVFDDVIPSDMRITDIVTVLRNSKFEVRYGEDPRNRQNPDTPRWLLAAARRQGPDALELLIAVEGEKYVMDREQIMGDNRIKLSGSKESGRMRLSVLGTLPREHADLTREMNLLQQALRDRFRFQQTSRR
jgi:hypothetical protein